MLLHEPHVLMACDKTVTVVLFALLLNISFSGTSIEQNTRDSWNGSEVEQISYIPGMVRLRHHHRKYLTEEKDLKSDFLAMNLRSLLEESGRYGGEKPPWPVKREAILEGDLILGGNCMSFTIFTLLNI